jgi:hypothetical protein
MIINDKSVLKDILQAVSGTWSVAEDNGWRCIECGKIRFFKKVCAAGSNVLPQKFIKERTEVTPVLEFRKNSIAGQVLTLQQTAIECQQNCVCLIIQF